MSEINDRTPNLNLAQPHLDNDLTVDVLRIRESFSTLDVVVPEKAPLDSPELYRNSGRFKQIIENPLVKHGLERKAPGSLSITAKGHRFLRQWGIESDVPAEGTTVQPAGPRPFRPLNFSRMMAGRPYRPGMDDYVSVPSKAGSEIIPYRR